MSDRLTFTPDAEALLEVMAEHLAAVEDLARAQVRVREARRALVTLLHDAGLTGFVL